MGNKKKNKDKKTASGEDTSSCPPAVTLHQGTTCLATSGSLDPPAQAPDISSSSEMETGKTRGGTRFSVGGGNDASTTSATATTPPAAGTIPQGEVLDGEIALEVDSPGAVPRQVDVGGAVSTQVDVGGGNDAPTTSAAATTPPAAGTIQPGDVQGRPLRWTPLGWFQHRLIQVWTRGTYRQWVRDVFLLAARALNWHVRWHAPPRQLNAGWPIEMRT